MNKWLDTNRDYLLVILLGLFAVIVGLVRPTTTWLDMAWFMAYGILLGAAWRVHRLQRRVAELEEQAKQLRQLLNK